MTRSTTVNQESRLVEMVEQIRVLQESVKDKEELREEIKKNALRNRNAILEELRSIFGANIINKGKGVVCESSEGAGEPTAAAGITMGSLGGRGLLPSLRGPSHPSSLQDSNSMGFVVDAQGMTRFISKIKCSRYD
ncbi:hypothetical protein MANES_05G186754v8 [Manihot esculenta]|uniref:Uncharacterized protein n=1 Tax=Manihot esculenta TaxID=3983 RepID=A0ACB7HNQ4_MANES|nr:hypothetical protein MANES_05G186754v8 [Manihot esculenta]